jgi:hypothetical protein
MSDRISEIQARQKALVAECAAQRLAFATAWHSLEGPAAATKRAVSWLRSPWLWAGVGLVAFKLRLRRFSRIPILLWKGWNVARKVHAIIQ